MIYVRGRGATISDIGGKEYLDGLSGLWNVNVGHGRTELADAAAQQMKELAYFSGYVGSSSVPAITLASRLVELAGDMAGIFFTSGGAESNESAFKTARFYWKTKGKPDKVKVISRFNAYHGVTLQAMSATGMAPYWKMFEPRVPGFVHIPTCYPYRQEGAKPGETAGQTAARLLEEAIVREGADTVAAFIAEPIHGGGGVLYPTDDYLPLVRKVGDKHQLLFLADEVITGGRRRGGGGGGGRGDEGGWRREKEGGPWGGARGPPAGAHPPRPPRAHLLRAAADHQRGSGRPPRLGHPRRDQGRHRRLAHALS